jgi:hypothetical protein
VTATGTAMAAASLPGPGVPAGTHLHKSSGRGTPVMLNDSSAFKLLKGWVQHDLGERQGKEGTLPCIAWDLSGRHSVLMAVSPNACRQRQHM